MPQLPSRYAGFKGVLAAWPDHIFEQSHSLIFRKSMCKFPSTHTDLEILNWAKFSPAFLNRQIITVLSTLGVKDDAFINLQVQMIDDFRHFENDRGFNVFVMFPTSCCFPPFED